MNFIANYIQDIKATIITNRYNKMVAKLRHKDFKLTDNVLFMKRLDRARTAYLQLPK